MEAQMELFASEGKKQVFIDNIDPGDCVIDPFNSRKTRPPEHVEKLAARMVKYGYDKTRAVWARRNADSDFSVFAGGTRLDAARQAGIKIAVILHEGYTDEEIAWLTELDNESDEYHVPVGPVDMWAEYARLRDIEGWPQQRIADAKGVGQSLVSERLKWHGLPEHIKEFIYQGLLAEAHLRQITSISIGRYFTPWQTTEGVWEMLADWAAEGQPVSQTKKKVGEWKNLVKLAEKTYENFKEDITLYDFSGEKPEPHSYNEREAFIDELVERKVITQVAAKEAKGAVEIFVAKNLKEYEVWVREQTAEAARRAMRAEKEGELLGKVHHGDFRETMKALGDNSVDLIFTDPPYGEDCLMYYGELAEIATRVLKPGGSLIAYAGHYALPQIFEAMCPHLRYWWLLGIKHTGGLSSLTGKRVYVQWKPLVWFVKESYGGRGKEFVFDFVESEQEKDLHEWQQGMIEAKYYIEGLTEESALVVDPFGGSGTTAEAALETKRDFWIGDIEPEQIDKIKNRILGWLDKEEKKDGAG